MVTSVVTYSAISMKLANGLDSARVFSMMFFVFSFIDRSVALPTKPNKQYFNKYISQHGLTSDIIML